MGSSISVLPSSDALFMSSMDRSLSNGCDLFLKDDLARDVFIEYVKLGEWKDKVGDSTASHLADKTKLSLKRLSMSVFSNFIFPSSPSEIATQIIETRRDNYYSSSTPTTNDTPEMRFKIRNILLAAIFPMFLESEMYQAYRNSTRIVYKNMFKSETVIVINLSAIINYWDTLTTTFPLI